MKKRLWFKHVLVAVLVAFLGSTTLSCGTSSSQAARAGDGLRLSAVAHLFEPAANGHDFERLLNESGINNLNLDEDGDIDHIDVLEHGVGLNRGFSLSVEMTDKDTGVKHIQQVAEVNLYLGHDGWVRYQVEGNVQLYGVGHYWGGRLHRDHLPFFVWAFTPNRTVYVPTYRHSYDYSRPRARVMTVKEYETRTVTVTKTSKVIKQVKKETTQDPAAKALGASPNANSVSPIIKAPLATPTQTQKQFQEANPSTTTLKGSFGSQKPKTSEKVVPGTTITPTPGTAAKPSLTKPTETQKQFKEDNTQKDLGTGAFGAGKQTPGTPLALPPGSTTPLPPGKALVPKASEDDVIKKKREAAEAAVEAAKRKKADDALKATPAAPSKAIESPKAAPSAPKAAPSAPKAAPSTSSNTSSSTTKKNK